MHRTNDTISVRIITHELRVIFKFVYEEITNGLTSLKPGKVYLAFQMRLSCHLPPTNRKIKIDAITSSGARGGAVVWGHCTTSRGSIPDGAIDIILPTAPWHWSRLSL